MKWYQYEVVETVVKTVWVEANTEVEAEAMALESDLDKNFDFYNREACLLEADYEDHD